MNERATRPLRILFVMRRLSYLVFVKSVLELVAERGHKLVLLLEEHPSAPAQQAWLDEMSARPNFTCIIEDQFAGDPARGHAIHTRRAYEYLRLQAPRFADRNFHQKRKNREQAPHWIIKLGDQRALRTRAGHWLLSTAVGGLDRAMPMPRKPARFIRETAPDAVVVLDHGRPGSLHSAYVQAAREQAIPVALLVASWDNLTTRQITRTMPDELIVWNEWQVREAVDMHGVPREAIVTTGAPSFDEWFTRTPSDKRTFMEGKGLDPERPYVLWIGGALHPAIRTEAEFAREWLGALRESSDATLRTIGVMLRPHPLRVRQWFATDFSDFENAIVFPGPDMTAPLAADQRTDYFNSIYHASAVVGINSSGMIEAAIVGHPVLSILAPEFHESQRGTFHFSYLLEENGGPVRTAATIDEHLEQLAASLRGEDAASREQARSFVERFVRPHGLSRPATPIAADAIEELARRSVAAHRDPTRVRLVRNGIRVYFRAGQIPTAVRLRVKRASTRARR